MGGRRQGRGGGWPRRTEILPLSLFSLLRIHLSAAIAHCRRQGSPLSEQRTDPPGFEHQVMALILPASPSTGSWSL